MVHVWSRSQSWAHLLNILEIHKTSHWNYNSLNKSRQPLKHFYVRVQINMNPKSLISISIFHGSTIERDEDLSRAKDKHWMYEINSFGGKQNSTLRTNSGNNTWGKWLPIQPDDSICAYKPGHGQSANDGQDCLPSEIHYPLTLNYYSKILALTFFETVFVRN